MLPRVYVADWVSPRKHRSETRSIHPDLAVADVSTDVDVAAVLVPAARPDAAT